MAHLALLRDACGQMVRVGCTLIVLQMAGDASCGRQIEISASMALVTLQFRMPAGERKPDRVVIEIRGLPGRRGVALLAGLRETECDVVGVARLLEIRQVAAHAGGRRSRVLSTRMTGDTVQGRVHPGQSEVREFQVIKLRAQPGVNRVALLALDRKPGSNMIGCGRLLVSTLVAGVALGRKSLELPDRLAFMAVRAIQARVSSNQRKPVIVFLHPLKDDAPALHGMALLAVGTHLPAMDVGVAIGAVCSCVRKHGLGMALGAGHSLMQATERVFSVVVIELRNCADGLPSRRGVAVLTGYIQVSVRTARGRRTARLPESGGQTASQDQADCSQDQRCCRK